MMFKVMAALGCALVVTGCASSIGAFVNRPVVEDGVKDVVSTVSLASDRRAVVVVTQGESKSKFCAEPPPDTATSLKSDLEAKLKAKGGKESAGIDVEVDTDLKDKNETKVTVIAERTAPLDAFRTGVYALCQYHLNGAIAKEDVAPLFARLIEAFAVSSRDSARTPAAPERVSTAGK
jgi:hypothetical protein